MSGSVSMITGHIDRKTQYERIRSMTIPQLAKFLYEIRDDTAPDFADKRVDKIIDGIDFIDCSPQAVQHWLESEVEEE